MIGSKKEAIGFFGLRDDGSSQGADDNDYDGEPYELELPPASDKARRRKRREYG
ncbi:MAG: hypothetical protein IT381_02180 [Deltaproteobacteria bacterium]|nr:hypothetical protein [Deltaproteobacteria bacterium]